MGVVVNLSSNGVAGAFFARTQLAEWLPASLARQLPSRHRHIWVESGNNAARAGEDRWQGTCRDCLCRCQLTASGRDKGAAAVADHGCIDQDGHHFHGSLEGTGDEGQDCEGSAWCCKCGTRVHAVLQPPVLLPEAVQALEAARLAAHPHHPTQGARELVATVSTLYRIAKNASEGDQRPIKSDSEKPRRLLKFDAPCMRLLQALGFEQRGAELHPPLIVDSLSFDVPRRRLELARDELALLTARMLRKLPESERTASHGVTPLVYVGEALTRWLGVHAYARRQQSGLALLATAHGGAVDDAYRRLGVPEDAADALVAWAYRRQVEEDPETAGARAQRRYDSLAAICAARTSSGELLALVDSERDRGLVATASVRAACLALFGDSLLDVGGVDSDTIREVFLAKLADTYKTDAKMELAAHLAILACAKHDQGLEDYAANVKVNIEAQVTEKVNTWVQLPIGLANIGNTCHLNCMLQCLFSILPIRNAVLRFGDKKTWNEDVVPGRQDSGRLLDAAEIARALKFVALLKDLFESLWTAEREETLGEISNIYESVTVDSMAYTLHAVFIHSGLTPEFGHYWVYIRDHDRVQRQVRWLKFNDSYVTVVDQAEIFRNAPAAGEESANPYYLVYVRSMELDDIVDLGI
ncbi:ubiquitin-specific protease ubp2 [Coemansia thaxteri]|nr:ubiquitin-specific protease ubp2 [Coemansia thaxteri]